MKRYFVVLCIHKITEETTVYTVKESKSEAEKLCETLIEDKDNPFNFVIIDIMDDPDPTQIESWTVKSYI